MQVWVAETNKLNLWDVTGDGKDEVILSSEPNMHVDWNSL